MKWINIENRLPLCAGFYIVCDCFLGIIEKVEFDGKSKWNWMMNTTHWMPLPQMPGGKCKWCDKKGKFTTCGACWQKMLEAAKGIDTLFEKSADQVKRIEEKTGPAPSRDSVTKQVIRGKDHPKPKVGDIHWERNPLTEWFWCLTEVKEQESGFIETWVRLGKEKDS